MDAVSALVNHDPQARAISARLMDAAGHLSIRQLAADLLGMTADTGLKNHKGTGITVAGGRLASVVWRLLVPSPQCGERGSTSQDLDFTVKGETMNRTTFRVVNVMYVVLAVVFSVAVAVEAQFPPPAPVPPTTPTPPEARESESATAAQQLMQLQQQLLTPTGAASAVLLQSSCSLCFTCGGTWPIFSGSWPLAAPMNPSERGSACANPLMTRPDSRPFLCCR
jgi:hypothetical protein